MDTTTPGITASQHLFDLQLEPTTIGYLREGARWARFIAITGFVLCGLMILVGLFAGSMVATMMPASMDGSAFLGGGFFTVIYIAMAALWFFPCLYLYRFAVNMRTALDGNELEKLQISALNLKKHYKFVGVLIIVMLCIYALAIVGGIIAAASMSIN